MRLECVKRDTYQSDTVAWPGGARRECHGWRWLDASARGLAGARDRDLGRVGAMVPGAGVERSCGLLARPAQDRAGPGWPGWGAALLFLTCSCGLLLAGVLVLGVVPLVGGRQPCQTGAPRGTLDRPQIQVEDPWGWWAWGET